MCSHIVNSAISRQNNGTLMIPTKPSRWLTEKVVHTTDKYKDEFMDGCIQEEAEMRVGGAERLKQAVSSGRVKRITNPEDKGAELYCFPKIKVGRQETYSHARNAEGSQEITTDHFNELKDAVINNQWQLSDCTANMLEDRDNNCK